MPENTYEITYIVNSVLSDDQIRNLVSRITKFIEKEGGNIVEVDEWGAQRLAYPIDKKRTGYYVNAYFEAGGELIARLERALTLEDDILRFLTLKMDAVMLRHYEERKKERAREKAEGVKEKESITDKEAQVSVAREQAESPPAPKEETKAAEVSPEETKAEAPVGEEKAKASAKETKAEAPVEEEKAKASAKETKAETPAEEKKAKTSAKETKAEAPAPKEETEGETSAEDTKAADQE